MVNRLQSFIPVWNQHQLFPSSTLWNQLQHLQSGMNGLLNRWNGDGGQAPGMAAAYPAVNIWEDAESVHVEAELPGLEQEDLEIHITGGNQLTIKGERKEKVPEKGIWHRQERGFGSFVRVLTLPIEVDREKVEARFENGILLVKLAKQESSKPRKIIVKSQ
jgi:HSP20 family protein